MTAPISILNFSARFFSSSSPAHPRDAAFPFHCIRVSRVSGNITAIVGR